MKTKVLGLLEDVRRILEDDAGGDTSYEGPGGGGEMDRDGAGRDDAGPEGEVDTAEPSPIEDFVTASLQKVQSSLGIEDNELALDAVFAAIDAMTEAGLLPELPEDEEVSPETADEWVVAAEDIGLLGAMMLVAHDFSSEEGGEDEEGEEEVPPEESPEASPDEGGIGSEAGVTGGSEDEVA